MPKRARKGQQELDLRTWGGRRKGAGRPPTGRRAGVSHARREAISGREPLHVTVRVAEDVWNLRTKRGFAALLGPLSSSADRNGMRVSHFSVQGNHLHLLIEAEDATALSRGMQGLLVRVARSVNRRMGRRGVVFPDRYHAHVLRTPTEVRNAIRYVLGNAAIHARRLGKQARDVDRFAAGPGTGPRNGITASPRTWLLRREVAGRQAELETDGLNGRSLDHARA